MKIVNRNISLKSVSNSGIWLELLSLAFVFLTLATALYSIEQAVWVSPQPSLLFTLLLAVVTAMVFIKSRLPAVVKHGSLLLLGTIVTIWQLSSLVAPQPLWKALHARPNESTVYFTVFLVLGTWVVGYIATWFMVQRRNAWVAVFMGAVVVMVNLNNLPPKEYYHFFPVYTLSAILLIGQANMAKNLRQLRRYGQSYSKRGAIYYAGVVVLFGALIASSAQFLPEIKTNPDLAISNKISWNNSETQWINIFAAVPEKRGALNIGKQSELLFSDAPYWDETIHFMVTSDKADYLRTNRYDSYLSWGWSGTSTVDSMFYPGKKSLASEFLRREELTYTVTNKLKTSLLLVTGEFKTASLPVVLQALASQPVTAQLDGGARDIISVIAPHDILPNDTYKITVWFTQATPIELFQAGTDYDKWVTDHYLQLPKSLPERVKELSREITREAKTPYDKAIRIRNFLQRFTYNTVFNTPPGDVDAVDYFIFEKKAGDCTYFASSMAVMLRSVGVPARVSSGYRLEEKDKSTGQFILSTQDYHARAEVFFPGYGWIEFEATPGLPGLSTDVDEVLGNIGLETTLNTTQNITHNTTQNFTQNTTQKIKVAYINYDEEGHLLDEFGNPIYDKEEINMMALPPSPNQTPALSTNVTPALSRNATSPLSPNATSPLSRNATSPASPNTTPVPSPNTTSAQSRGENNIPPGNVFGKIAPSYPTVLPAMGILSLIMFIIGVVGIFLYQRWLNRIRRTVDASRVYARMCALASMSKSGPKPIETPFEYGFRLALAIPTQSQIIDSITRIYAESRFSWQKELDQSKRVELETSWFQLYPVLVRRILHRP